MVFVRMRGIVSIIGGDPFSTEIQLVNRSNARAIDLVDFIAIDGKVVGVTCEVLKRVDRAEDRGAGLIIMEELLFYFKLRAGDDNAELEVIQVQRKPAAESQVTVGEEGEFRNPAGSYGGIISDEVAVRLIRINLDWSGSMILIV
jgi:hypothetical protein